MKQTKKNITPRSQDYSQWYLDIVREADLAENSVVRGCMVIKPYGYAIWENFKKELDKMFKDTGHENAYFPLFIPKSFLAREAEHVEGFAKECAVVTHHRLKVDKKEGVVVDPQARLAEELVVRPTSETIIYDSFSKWIKSWRDLPMLINQWANIVRWEMRTRPFLRTTEFLWQEGHTAHATLKEAEQETLQMLGVYQKFAETYLAIPVIAGKKSQSEKFAGALHTYCIEAMMQDGKALQAGTSHNLGQNFAKPFKVMFTDRDGKNKYVWQTSWGVTTRLVGALIMAHSDDLGLVLPPKIAPLQVVIVPIWKSDQEQKQVLELAQNLKRQLEKKYSVKLDDRDYLKPGFKFSDWETKGVPIRLEVGPKDVAAGQVVVVRRDNLEKQPVSIEQLESHLTEILNDIQTVLYKRAKKFLTDNTHQVDSYDEFKDVIKNKHGFVLAHWDGTPETEAKIQAETQATIRCIPLKGKKEAGQCIFSGKPSKQRVVFAKAY